MEILSKGMADARYKGLSGKVATGNHRYQ